MLAALINACKLTGKRLSDLHVLIIGLGAAGVAVTKILLEAGVATSSAPTRAARCPVRADYQDGSMPPSSAGTRRPPTPTAAGGPATSSTASTS